MYDTAVDARVRTIRDAAYISMVRWVATNTGPNDLVDATDGLSQFVLHGVRIQSDKLLWEACFAPSLSTSSTRALL